MVQVIGLSYLPEKKLIDMAQYIGTNFYIKPTYIVALSEYDTPRYTRSEEQVRNEVNLKSNEHLGVLSRKSQQKLRNAVNWLISSAKDKHLWSAKHKKVFQFKINFITLTFPFDGTQHVPEKQAKRCIHSWLSYSRKYSFLRNYVWKFERTAKGQLHVHLTTDTFISYLRIRRSWNRILVREGLLDSFMARFGHADANSTDVHAVKRVKNIAAYISKYMAKSQEAMPDFKGRIWACNREISDANKCSTTLFAGDADICQKVLTDTDTPFKAILSPPDAMGRCRQIGEVYLMNEERWRKMQKSIIKATYDEHRYHIRNNIAKLPDEYWQAVINEYFDNISYNGKKSTPVPPEQLPDSIVHASDQKEIRQRSKYHQASLAL